MHITAWMRLSKLGRVVLSVNNVKEEEWLQCDKIPQIKMINLITYRTSDEFCIFYFHELEDILRIRRHLNKVTELLKYASVETK
jgi:hypothetical protein